MPIQFHCPNCKTVYEVADDLAGKFIMCRGCQKRGPVRSLGGKPNSGGGLATAVATATATASRPSRRNFLQIGGWVLASIGAIATGAVLARKPWRRWNYTTELRDPNMTTRRGFGGPPRRRDDEKDSKGGDKKDSK